MMIMMSFFSATPIFSVKKNQGNPEFLGALNFILKFFGGSFFDHPTVAAHEPTELIQVIDQPAEIPYPNHIPGLKTHSLGLGLG